MATDPLDALHRRNLDEVIEITNRQLAESEAKERTPLARIARAWAALTGADLPPKRPRP